MAGVKRFRQSNGFTKERRAKHLPTVGFAWRIGRRSALPAAFPIALHPGGPAHPKHGVPWFHERGRYGMALEGCLYGAARTLCREHYKFGSHKAARNWTRYPASFNAAIPASAKAVVMGNSLDMRKTALDLDLATEQIMEAVKARTGEPDSVVKSWFSPTEDKYFTADEAVHVGLADGLFELPSTPSVIPE
jgi:phytoene dehydrogenase-like protein